jgi:hypothetical protein
MENSRKKIKQVEFIRTGNLLIRRAHDNEINNDFNFPPGTSVSKYCLWDMLSTPNLSTDHSYPVRHEEYNRHKDLQWGIFSEKNKLIAACSSIITDPDLESSERIAFVIAEPFSEGKVILEVAGILRQLSDIETNVPENSPDTEQEDGF